MKDFAPKVVLETLASKRPILILANNHMYFDKKNSVREHQEKYNPNKNLHLRRTSVKCSKNNPNLMVHSK